uniref:Uncharacterized protein n=1 Tax=Anguilla anguilla TaxID=7936 RepID=A0A0E9VV04_ANGAN
MPELPYEMQKKL